MSSGSDTRVIWGCIFSATTTAPIFLWELSLGIWLVVKGFSPSPGVAAS